MRYLQAISDSADVVKNVPMILDAIQAVPVLHAIIVCINVFRFLIAATRFDSYPDSPDER